MIDKVLILTSEEYDSKRFGGKVMEASFVFIKKSDMSPLYHCIKNRKTGREYYCDIEHIEKLREEYPND